MTPNVDLAAIQDDAIAHHEWSAAAPVATRHVGVERNQALDFTKGSLVLIMIFYHWFNYFVSLESEVYRYLRFLTPSFILITGFIVSHVYLAKPGLRKPQLYRRLINRGAKLLLLFTVLNILASLVVKKNYNGAELGVRAFVTGAYEVYVTGNGRAVFDVLVPISYFLLLVPVILVVANRLHVSLHIAAMAALLTAYIANVRGASSTNFELLSFAMLGMAIGTLPVFRIDRALKRPLLLVMAYALYLAAVTLWNVLFPLQVAGVCLSLSLIYILGVRWGSDGVVPRQFIELGKYSLFAYIAQVVLLQVLRRALQPFTLHGSGIFISLFLTILVTWAAVIVLSVARTRSAPIDRLYRTVFA